MKRSLSLPADLDVPLTLGIVKLPGTDPALRIRGHEALWALRLETGAATVHLQQRERRLEAEAWGAGAELVLERLPELVGARDDGALGFCPAEEPLRSLVRRHRGLRLPRTLEPWSVLLATVVGQRATGKDATRSVGLLTGLWGEPAPGPGGLRLPPSAERVRSLDWAELHRAGLEQRRAQTLRRAAAELPRITPGSGTPRDLAERRLAAVPGIGPWTLGRVRRLVWGDADAVETGDYNLPSTVAWNLAGEPRADDRRMLELLEPYRGHRGRVVELLERFGRGAPRFGPRRELVKVDRL